MWEKPPKSINTWDKWLEGHCDTKTISELTEADGWTAGMGWLAKQQQVSRYDLKKHPTQMQESGRQSDESFSLNKKDRAIPHPKNK